MLCISNHTACRSAKKKRCFSARFCPGCAVPPPRVLPFSKVKRSKNPSPGEAQTTTGLSPFSGPAPGAAAAEKRRETAGKRKPSPPPKRRIFQIKARWGGRGGLGGRGQPLSRQQRGSLSPQLSFLPSIKKASSHPEPVRSLSQACCRAFHAKRRHYTFSITRRKEAWRCIWTR